MTKRINPFKILILAAVISLPALSRAAGNEEGAEKKKTISRSYTVTAKDKLQIENSFGDVVINTWDKNEMKIDIEMSASASTEERAQSLLDEISVRESKTDNLISFKTNTNSVKNNGNSWSKNKGEGNNRKFEINYAVYMPAGNPLQIENQFGKMTVPDFKGPVNLTSKFGSLSAGSLENVELVDVEFGTAEIRHVQNGKINFQYDDKPHITNVSGSLKITIAFSDQTLVSIDNNIEELSINESYSAIKMIVSKDLSASFSIHTNFGEFRNRTDFNIKEDKEGDDDSGPRFDKDYNGNAGSGKAKIKIKSSFGEIRLSHSSDSSNEDDKERPEKKERKEKKEKKEQKEEKETEES
jgi:hypothetical protein